MTATLGIDIASSRPRRGTAWIRSQVVTALIGAAITGLALLCGTSPAAAAPTGPNGGVLFGTLVTPVAGQSAAAAMAAKESALGRGMAADRVYSRWDDQQPVGAVVDDAAHGRTPMLSITAQRADGSKVAWSAIATGAQDTQIRAQADALRDVGAPIILIFHHEADVAAGYGTSADFIAAYRHFAAVVRGEKATNVALAVVFTVPTFSNPSAWYPGDDVVDWIGADPYNQFGCAAGYNPAWRSLAQAAMPFYNWAAPRGKPLMLAEWGSVEDPNQPGRKASWITDAQTTLANWPAIKAVSYFDKVGSCDWRLSNSTTATAAYVALGHSSVANGAPSARLLADVPVGAAPLAETFRLDTSTGAHDVTGSGVTSYTLDFGDGSTPASGSGQPKAVSHLYPPGHWTARLTVFDGALSAATTATVIAAPAPTLSEGSASSITRSSARVPAWIYTSGIGGTYYYEWGPTTAYGNRSALMNLPAVDSTQAVTAQLAGLAPGTRCYWRYVATTAAGTTVGPDRWFATTT